MSISFKIDTSVFFSLKRKDTDVMLALNSDTPRFSVSLFALMSAEMSVMVIMADIMSQAHGADITSEP